MDIPHSNHYLALSGGVGGAKLVLGLSGVLAPDQMTVVANTGDDFEHLGLNICPDIDTVLYTLGPGGRELEFPGGVKTSWR
jgi:LPPG:FO 2-phospho-L-lactate transferase